MRRLAAIAALSGLAACHDFNAELAACVDSGICVKGGDIPQGPSIVIDLSGFMNNDVLEITHTPVGATTQQHVPVKNVGATESSMLTAMVTGDSTFSIVSGSDTCSGNVLGSNQTCEVVIEFRPTDGVESSGVLTVVAAQGGTAQARLHSRGETAANLELLPISEAFGSWTAGMSSTTHTLTLTNKGDRAATNVLVGLDDPDAGVFRVVVSSCQTQLAGGASCTVGVAFNPPGVGNFGATLVASADSTPSASSTLIGDGLAPPDAMLSISSTMIDFLSWNLGTTSPPSQLVVTNVGGQPTSMIDTLVGGAQAGDFILQTDTCKGATLARNQTCTISVAFSPQAAGPRSATLSVFALSGGSVNVMLSGGGQSPAALSFIPSLWDYGVVAPDAGQQVQPFTLTNSGTLPSGGLTVQLTDIDGGNFFVSTNNCPASLAGTMSCNVSVAFRPTVTGSASATLQALAPDSGASVPLTAVVLPPSYFSAMPSPVSFPDTVLNQLSAPVQVTVTNSFGSMTTGPVTLQTVGAFRNHFRIANGSCGGADLLPGNNCTFSATFYPRQDGGTPDLGPMQITVLVGGSNAGTLGVNLSGRSISQAALQVQEQTGPLTKFDFGKTDAGTTLIHDFVITNVGEATSGAIPLSVTNLDAGTNFSLGAGGTCAGATLANDAGCIQPVVFAANGYQVREGKLMVFASPGADGGSTGYDAGIFSFARLIASGQGLVQVDVYIDGGPNSGTKLQGWAFGDGGALTVDGGPLCMSRNCTFLFEGGQPAQIAATAVAPGWFFGGFTGSTCSGNGACTFIPGSAVSKQLINVGFSHYNFAFVTSGRFKADGGADCDTIAAAAGLPSDGSSYVFFRDHVSGTLAQLLGLGRNGWVRTDGKPYMDTIASGSSSAPVGLFPISCDENGACLAPTTGSTEEVWTGMKLSSTGYNSTGTFTCGDWTISDATDGGTYGSIFGVGHRGVRLITTPDTCDSTKHWICLEHDTDFNLPSSLLTVPVPAGGRRAFTSNATFDGAANAGAVNGACVAEASDAGLPNAAGFVAFRVPQNALATSVLRLDAGDWYRPDGYRVLANSTLATTSNLTLEAPMVMDAWGRVSSTQAGERTVWTGAHSSSPRVVSTLADTCTNWTTNLSTDAGSFGSTELTTSEGWFDSRSTCDNARPVWCFER